jgi:hypothetical protein
MMYYSVIIISTIMSLIKGRMSHIYRLLMDYMQLRNHPDSLHESHDSPMFVISMFVQPYSNHKNITS